MFRKRPRQQRKRGSKQSGGSWAQRPKPDNVRPRTPVWILPGHPTRAQRNLLALLQRRAAKTRAVLPNPSARAEWLLAGLIDRSLSHWARTSSLDGGGGDDDTDTGTDTAIPDDDDDDDIASLASRQSTSLQHSNLQLCLLLLSLMFQGGLELESVFEDHGACTEVITDSFAFERAICGRCALVRPTSISLTAGQQAKECSPLDRPRYCLCPPASHQRVCPSQILDLAHTWSDRGDDDIDLSDILALTAAFNMFIKLDPAAATTAPRTLPELLTAVVELLTRR